MLKLEPRIDTFLAGGGVLVVPSRARAAAVRLAYAAARLSEERTVWDSPDVMAWSDWTRRESEAAAFAGEGRSARLPGACEDWLMWLGAVRERAGRSGVLLPDTLLGAARRARSLAFDWGIDPARIGDEEGALLAEVASLRMNAGLSCGGSVDELWRSVETPFAQPHWFLGFDELGTALRRRLLTRGARIGRGPDEPRDAGPATVRVVAATDEEDEARRVAEWCRDRIARDPRVRLLVLVPGLERRADSLRRELLHALGPGSIRAGTIDDPPFAFESGRSLALQGPVRVALALLRLAAGGVEFADFALILRSPWLGLGRREVRLALEVWLRGENATTIQPRDLRRIAERATRNLSGAEALVDAWQKPLAAFEPERRQGPAAWGRRTAELLAAFGWPGDAPLCAAEREVCERFGARLSEFAAADDVLGEIDGAQACDHVVAWLTEDVFEPAADDAPVCVSASLGDPVVGYDGIWVAGLAAEDWPPPVAADPLLPIDLLRRAGVSRASPQGQLRLAHEAQAAWARCTSELVLSHPTLRHETACRPSPLLPRAAAMPGALSAPAPRTLEALVQTLATSEPFEGGFAPRWSGAEPLPRGSSLLELQSSCPFRADAEVRLGADSLGAPLPGIDARVHGQMLHAALDLVWREIGSSRALEALDAVARRALAQRRVAEAVATIARRLLVPVAPLVLAVEVDRCVARVLDALEAEATRTAFRVEARESTRDLPLGGHMLRLRIDRIDRLDDGRCLVIDYKSGRPEAFDPLADPPRNAQLLAYAVANPGGLAGVATLHLRADGIAWRGAQQEAGLLPGTSLARSVRGDWEPLQERWRAMLEGLVEAFAAGRAAVAPQPGACDYCPLAMLCRIPGALGAAATPEDDTGADGDRRD